MITGFLFLCLGFSACDQWELIRINLPEVITTADVQAGANPTQAMLGGEILGLLDNTSVDEHGHLWSETITEPTLDEDVKFTRLNRRNNGAFQSQVEGLRPGRRIYYRAYAVLEDKHSYGEVFSYTPADLSLQLQTEEVVSSEQDQAISRITLRSVVSGLPAQLTIQSYGLVWATRENPTVEADNLTIDGSEILNNAVQFSYQSTLTNLSYDAFYVRPYLAVADIVYYGPNFCLAPGDFSEERVIAGAPDPACNYYHFSIDDKVYFVGFSREGCTSWCYDPQTNRFSEKAGFPGIPRSFAKTAVADGKGYLGFGISGPPDVLMDDIWEYDPATDQWTQKASLVSGRYQPIVFAIGSYIYAGSGQEPPPVGSPDPWVNVYDFRRFDPAADTWTRLGDSPGILPYGSMSFALNGKGFILGSGMGFWEYLPQTDTWNEKVLTIDELTYGTPKLNGIVEQGAYISGNGYRWRYNALEDTWTALGAGFEIAPFAGLGRLGYRLTFNGIEVYYPPQECQ